MKEGDLFQRAFEDAAIGISLLAVEPVGQYLEVNPAFCRMTGYSREELLARDFQSITASQDLNKNLERVQTLLSGTVPSLQIEKQYIRKDGSSFWACLHASLARDNKGKPLYIIVQIEDIDERIRAEEALKESEDHHRILIETTSDAIITIDEESRILSVNSATEKIFGHSRAEMLGQKVTMLMPESFRDVHLASVERYIVTGERHIAWEAVELTGLHKSGKEIPLEISFGEFIKNGRHLFTGIIRDITERKRAEENLQRQTAALHELHAINTLPGLDKRKLCDEVVTALASFFEVPYATVERLTRMELEVLSMWERGILKHGMRTPLAGSPCENVRRERKTCQHQGSLTEQFPDDPFFALHPIQSYLGSPIYDSERQVIGVVNLMHDVPRTFTDDDVQIMQLFGQVVGAFVERKHLEEQLRHSQKLEAIGQLAGGVAHEFNNLLTAIIGNLDLAIKQTTSGTDLQSALVRSEQAAHRAAMLTRQLLTLSRRSPVELQPRDLGLISEEVALLLRQTIDRRIRITVESSHGLWPVLADADQMHQAVMNLCVNARDAVAERLDRGTESGSSWQPLIAVKTENVRINETYCSTHPDAKPGEYVCLSVTDNGSGIGQEVQPHLFEPFFTTKEVGRGTGLGLATVYGIVKQHDGWIELTSAKDEGTTFRIYLPRTQRQAVPIAPEKVSEEAVTGGTETILFVDDEAPIRRLGQTVLEHHGYTVLLAKDGVEALEIFRRERDRIGLVVLDLTMPRQSGQEVLKQLLMLDPELKVIVSSGHHMASSVNELQDLGTVEFVPKPYRPDELARSVRKLLDQPDHV